MSDQQRAVIAAALRWYSVRVAEREGQRAGIPKKASPATYTPTRAQRLEADIDLEAAVAALVTA